jgi:hypothetical protein
MVMIVSTTGRVYCAVFLVFLFGLPLLFLGLAIGDQDYDTAWMLASIETFLVVTYVLNYLRCSSPAMTYWQGMCLISKHWLSCLVVLSLMVIFPLLFLVHFLSLPFSLVSLVAGRRWAQVPFLYLAYWTSRGEFDLRQAKALLPPPEASPV